MPDWVGDLRVVAGFFAGSLLFTVLLALVLNGRGGRRLLQAVAVLLGGLSIVSATFDAQDKAARWDAELLKPRIEGARRSLDMQLTGSIRSTCDFRFQGSEIFPATPELEEANAQLGKACLIIRSIESAVADKSVGARIAVEHVERSKVTDPYADQFISWVLRELEQYNSLVDERSRLLMESETDNWEIQLTMIAPFLAAFGTSIALALIAIPESDQSCLRKAVRVWFRRAHR